MQHIITDTNDLKNNYLNILEILGMNITMDTNALKATFARRQVVHNAQILPPLIHRNDERAPLVGYLLSLQYERNTTPNG